MKKKLMAGAAIWLSFVAICITIAFAFNPIKRINTYEDFGVAQQPNIVFWTVSQDDNELLDDAIKQQLRPGIFSIPSGDLFYRQHHNANYILFSIPNYSKKETIPTVKGRIDQISSRDIIELKGLKSTSVSFKLMIPEDNVEVYGFYHYSGDNLYDTNFPQFHFQNQTQVAIYN